ncbi:MAG: S41 family peptidase [Sphingopyxis sp.]|uniref:S41 family peptidase n=1 Tax=Sphingopyxis sp. TaxID=1908224 RepID=UPI002ABC49DF|nr:S41 family peptidase [Sphingopyxis sp.]MDZ3832113.1 S41 family peptidase [Sphingopyxis sp.]
MKRFCAALLLSFVALPAAAQSINAHDRKATIDAIATLLETRYVDGALGARIAEELRSGRAQWRTVADGPTLAIALTAWLRQQSGDGHLAVDYSAAEIPAQGGDAAFAAEEVERYYGAHINHGVQKIERLDGNIMLIDLRVFPPPALGGDVIAAMMTVAAQGDALIIDLRRNGGGMETLDMILSHLLPPGSPLSGVYDRPSDRLTPRLSPPAPAGRRFGEDKPVYVLTSKRTFSAAEALAYDLQALKRAIIVGEITGGGANPFEYRRVHPHFALSLPEQRSVNPITGTNWQGVGVKPDVAVPAADALDKALALAHAALAQKGS